MTDNDGQFTYIDISSVDSISKTICQPQQIISIEAPSRARQRVATNDVIVATVRPNLNAVALVPEDLDGAIASTGFCVLRPNPSLIDPKFLYYWVTTSHFVRSMVRLTTGQNYPAVSDGAIKSSSMPYVPLPEQKHISSILDKANTLRRKRAETLRLANDFLKSVFLDMFGDPITNPKGWPPVPLSHHGKVTTGNTPPRSVSSYYGRFIEWIKSDNINTPSHILSKATEGLSEEGFAVCRWVPAGSTLVTCIAGSPSCIGNAALSDRRVAFNQQINAITPTEKTDPYFLYMLVVLSKRAIQRASTSGMKGMVSKSQFSSVMTIAPPPKMQEIFGKLMRKTLSSVEKTESAKYQTEDLFASLVQRAFRGEL